jgi:uncharacterized membrane protein YsdA (DUF1294 family)/cold shock CspA family protein
MTQMRTPDQRFPDATYIERNPKRDAMRSKGKITTWNDEKGFGFITPGSGGKQVFVHIKAFSNPNRRPEVNQLVTYALSSDGQGRPRAIRATLAGDRLPEKARRTTGSLSVIGAASFIVVVGVAVLASRIPALVLIHYMAASLLTFILYAADKSAAREGAWRTQESTLHLLSLAGGWPGALVAQQKLRHKSRKQSFRSVFRITVLLNCGAFIWLLMPGGGETLRALSAGVA